MSELELVIDRATREELNKYVISTWLSSYALSFIGKLMRADSRYGVGREVYWTAQRSKIERILATSTVSVRVAHYDGEPVGWVCDDQTRRRVHFIFTNSVFRKQGVAKALMPSWYGDTSQPVFLGHLPPPWYSRRTADGEAPAWPGHVSIDLVSPE